MYLCGRYGTGTNTRTVPGAYPYPYGTRKPVYGTFVLDRDAGEASGRNRPTPRGGERAGRDCARNDAGV